MGNSISHFRFRGRIRIIFRNCKIAQLCPFDRSCFRSSPHSLRRFFFVGFWSLNLNIFVNKFLVYLTLYIICRACAQFYVYRTSVAFSLDLKCFYLPYSVALEFFCLFFVFQIRNRLGWIWAHPPLCKRAK